MMTKMEKDKARIQTEKLLSKSEKDIEKVYTSNKELKKAIKEYTKYMERLQKATEGLFKAYKDEEDINAKKDAKNAYIAEILAQTIESKEYQRIISKLTASITKVNQKAIDKINEITAEIYAINYNQVAEDCRKVGIKVGKAE